MRSALSRRGLSVALVVLVATGAVTATTSPAAATSGTFLRPTSFARTDSRAPHSTITTGDAVVGAYRDDHGRRHVTKTYLTFDITQFRGRQVLEAEINLLELTAKDCTRARATEIWLTRPPRTVPTWADAPKEILRLNGPGSTTGCPPQYIGFGVGDALTKAVAAGWDTMTLVLRVAEDKQRDPAYGRTYSSDTGLYVEYNTPPNTPTDLTTAGKACGSAPVLTNARDVELRGSISDPDAYWPMTTRIAYWPADDPAGRVERVADAYSSPFSITIPQSQLADGRGYVWQARSEDTNSAASAWSASCAFTLDWTGPSAPPTVASAVYPPIDGGAQGGGDGVPGDFTFTANGAADVVAFEWEGLCVPSGRVDADRPGGSATVTLTPTSDGPCDITVRGLDQAGNRSDETRYRFWVRETSPIVTMPWPKIGEPLPVTFTARQDGATTFTYQLDQLPEVTVPVGVDGTAAVVLDLPEGESHRLRVWTVNADGLRSAVEDRSFTVDMAAPDVELQRYETGLDEPNEVTFRPNLPNVVSYTYWLDPAHKVTVPAEPDGTARVTVTPPRVGSYSVSALSTTATGVNSGVGQAYGYVTYVEPAVTSTDYPRDVESGAPGVPGTFRFTAPIPNVAEYHYVFDNGAEVVVPAAADGTATATITPASPGYKWLSVYAVSSSGGVTGTASYPVDVSEALPVVDGVPTAPVVEGTQLELTFTATQPGAVEFTYDLFNVKTVVPAVDGKATVTITASDKWFLGRMELSIRSRTADGFESGAATAWIYVTRT